MDAVILLNKPAGMTSFAAVNKARRILSEKKAGHTGTLDPNAQGLMILLFGRYTKLTPYCVSGHKHYHAQFRLGFLSDTEDIWGTVTDRKEPHVHEDAELKALCQRWIGEREQTPPMYSAVKVNGQKLYQLARRGKEIERKPRKIEISALSVSHLNGDCYEMDAVVSSGTYIRTLIRDFCMDLGEYGTMSFLERQGIEDLTLAEAAGFDHLEDGRIDPRCIISPAWPLEEAAEYAKDIYCGRPVKADWKSSQVILTVNGEIAAAYEKRDDGLYHCQRGLF